jgi:adenosylcobinamide-GDP ribazoletransferase
VIAALAFLTVVGRGTETGPRAVPWFPVVGALVGGAVGAVWWGADHWWPPAVAGALAVATDLALTGLLHLDGLADTADGLLAPMDREKRMAVMSRPDVGAFAVGVVGTVLPLRVAALASMAPRVALVAALWCASRTIMAVAATALPPARPGGMAATFRAASPTVPAVVGLALCLVLAVPDPARTAAAVLGVAVGAAAVLALARRRIGGVTGDVLGAAGLVGETVGLIVAAANW